ncbi:alpha/beta hydrolase [Rasiella rasia]|uniref:Alpha/beta hydrolase n=1 Tax=Rasiella rasia TaxID=2744027 RepID=A0A6G6GN83_9FLAO|nr:alpha/beta hydrolase [Rasiella rasia]QIE60045.1 alpha/beta hydrolase [Rasiella rasia]
MKKIITKAISLFINSTAVIAPKWNAEQSFKLLCKVRRVGFTEKGKQFLATATTSHIDVGAHTVALHRWGTGPKNILFLHGWMSNSQRWRPYIAKLDLSQYTVYALDFPGHGMAKGNALNVEICRKALVKVIELTGPVDTLICHSLGCLVAAYTYLHNPKININRFVLMGAPSGMNAIFEYFQSLLKLSPKAIQNLHGKVNSVLQIPYEKVEMSNFFNTSKSPLLVIHDESDTVTPFLPIKEAFQLNKKIDTLITSGLKHDLKSESVYTAVINYINNKPRELNQKHSA